MALIGFSCVCTAFDSPLLDTTSGLGLVLEWLNLTLVVLFTLEIAIQVGAFGVRGYVRIDPWNKLDAVIVLMLILSQGLASIQDFTFPLLVELPRQPAPRGFLSLDFRAFHSCIRALRPLRVLNKMPQMKVVVHTLFRCVPEIAKAMLFYGFMLLMFAIASVILFKGALSTCSMSPYTYFESHESPPPWFPPTYNGTYTYEDLIQYDIMTFPRSWDAMPNATRAVVAPFWPHITCDQPSSSYPHHHLPCQAHETPTSKAVCEGFNLTWSQTVVPQSFDNILIAVASLYELTTMEGWSTVAIATVDAQGEDMQPVPNLRPGFLFFWIGFMITCAFFITNLFIGVLCDSFLREHYGLLVTDEQIAWIKVQKKLLYLAPIMHIPAPVHSPLR
jgi:voltage-dependent calcium channel L type alpha-1D